MRKLVLFLSLVLLLSLAACGGSGESASSEGEEQPIAGDAAAGKKVFTEVAAPVCSSCHSMDPDTTIIGPSIAGVGSRAGSRVAGKSAEDYLHESIVAPDAFVVDGFAAGLMNQTYGTTLSEQQIADLVAYMLTLK